MQFDTLTKNEVRDIIGPNPFFVGWEGRPLDLKFIVVGIGILQLNLQSSKSSNFLASSLFLNLTHLCFPFSFLFLCVSVASERMFSPTNDIQGITGQ